MCVCVCVVCVCVFCCHINISVLFNPFVLGSSFRTLAVNFVSDLFDFSEGFHNNDNDYNADTLRLEALNTYNVHRVKDINLTSN